jgi:hypothetical protein
MTYFAKNLTEKMGGAQIWLKREELAHTGELLRYLGVPRRVIMHACMRPDKETVYVENDSHMSVSLYPQR